MRVAAALAATLVATSASALKLDAAVEKKNRPVSKVVALLKDMRAQLEKETEEDQEIYDKMSCWCSKNDMSKSENIKKMEERVQMLGSRIEENTGKMAQLNTEIAQLETEVAHNKESLATATAMREKNLGLFHKEETDLVQSITALKSAVTVLGKHHGNPAGADLAQIRHMLKHQFEIKGYIK